MRSIAEDEKYEELKIALVASIESGLKEDKLNHASFMKECHVKIIHEENIISMVGMKLTSNNGIEEYNDVYQVRI